jgi:hypothetical protein
MNTDRLPRLDLCLFRYLQTGLGRLARFFKVSFRARPTAESRNPFDSLSSLRTSLWGGNRVADQTNPAPTHPARGTRAATRTPGHLCGEPSRLQGVGGPDDSGIWYLAPGRESGWPCTLHLVPGRAGGICVYPCDLWAPCAGWAGGSICVYLRDLRFLRGSVGGRPPDVRTPDARRSDRDRWRGR